MGKAIRASVLILLLTCTARAGWMGNESPTPPPPQPTSVAQEQTTDGEITTMSAGSLTQIALDLLTVLPSLL
jgi:ABC-type molybdate transport system substrate-binding protein